MKNAVFKYLKQINDVYFINDKIKQIDKHLQLFYNSISKKYEIHNINKKASFCLSFQAYPNEKLLIKLIKSLNKSVNQIMAEIDNHNEKIQQSYNNHLSNLAKDQLNEICNFSTKKLNKDLSLNQIKKIIQ